MNSSVFSLIKKQSNNKPVKKNLLFFVLGLWPLILCSQFDPRPVYSAPKAFSTPLIDGIADDTCWHYCKWTPLQHDWLLQPYIRGAKDLPPLFSPEDFSGRFKITWDENLLYILVEIRDDTIHDDIKDPLKEYWKDDCLEIFIDEDASRDFHNNNFSAFAYHMSPVTKDVVDFGNDQKPHLFNQNVDFEIVSTGDIHIWEIAVKIYDDKYVRGGFNTTEELYAGKVMGFSAAYCDDDGGDMDNFVGWVEGGLNSSKYADVFGTLILTENNVLKSIDESVFNGFFIILPAAWTIAILRLIPGNSLNMKLLIINLSWFLRNGKF